MKLGLPRLGKIHNYITYGIIFSLIVALVFEFIKQRWDFFFITVLSILLCLIPYFFQKRYKIYLPSEIQLAIVAFIYAGIFLGEVRNFYVKYWWWDSLLHTFSGFAMGLVVFGIMFVLYKTEKIRTSSIFIAIIIFSISISMGVVWELYEFIYDNTTGYGNMQRARNLCPETGICDSRIGLIDTMKDFILNTIGSGFAAILGYIYLKDGRSFLLNRIIDDFERNNPKLFYK